MFQGALPCIRTANSAMIRVTTDAASVGGVVVSERASLKSDVASSGVDNARDLRGKIVPSLRTKFLS